MRIMQIMTKIINLTIVKDRKKTPEMKETKVMKRIASIIMHLQRKS